MCLVLRGEANGAEYAYRVHNRSGRMDRNSGTAIRQTEPHRPSNRINS